MATLAPLTVLFNLYILNSLIVDAFGNSTADHNWWSSVKQKPLVKWQDLNLSLWKGSDPVLVCARGSVCVFSWEDETTGWDLERLSAFCSC